MLRSMTAYGRASFHSEEGQFVAEIQSVNRKFLDVSIHLPRELMRFENEIKSWLLPYASRGQITVRISAAFEKCAPVMVKPNLPLATQVKEAWSEIIQKLGLKEAVNAALLSRTDGLLVFEENFADEERYRQALKEVMLQALKGFDGMKRQEGRVLQEDMLVRLKKMQEWMGAIEKKAPDAPKKFRDKLIARLEEVLPGRIENEDRILREVAVYAEKIDIIEEVTRFGSHLKQMQELLEGQDGQVGKKLEFIVQEMNREVNTTGSKSSDIEITRYVIDIKSELERIREQIQNVE